MEGDARLDIEALGTRVTQLVAESREVEREGAQHGNSADPLKRGPVDLNRIGGRHRRSGCAMIEAY